VQPRVGLIGQVAVAEELPAVEEVLPQVADRPLDLALGLGPVRPAGADAEAPVSGEPQELGVLDQPLTLVTQVLGDHARHLVEEQLPRYAAEEAKRLFQAVDQGAHVLLRG